MASRNVFTSWWFGDALLLFICAGVIVVAALLSPAAEAVSFFGTEIPVLCGMRRLTGLSCPGCGLTRSFTFLAHGDLINGFSMNPLGPPLFALTASQLPWRVWRLYDGWRGQQARVSQG